MGSRGTAIVFELLVKMGYGGSRSDASQATGKSGDERQFAEIPRYFGDAHNM
jgi:hypothetical protein